MRVFHTAKSSLRVANWSGRNNGQKRTAGEEKIKKALGLRSLLSLSFLIKVAILQEGTGLTQDEEL